MSRKDISDLDVCLAYQEYRQKIDRGLYSPWPYEILARKLNQPEKVCFRAMERANEHGLIEYGVSIRSGWLTDKGLELINSPTTSEPPQPLTTKGVSNG